MRMWFTVLYMTLNWFGLSWGEVWEKDMSEEIYIEASHEGFNKVIMFIVYATFVAFVAVIILAAFVAGSTADTW